ncbi:hypothetical protein BaRGS_00028780 [Batillaria attramentaria]|uniref:Uncharacterized protein n=1 Tax=Batillaria attramentaria TaxID=370345 RepID=A0ABD0JZG0_9CAEN
MEVFEGQLRTSSWRSYEEIQVIFSIAGDCPPLVHATAPSSPCSQRQRRTVRAVPPLRTMPAPYYEEFRLTLRDGSRRRVVPKHQSARVLPNVPKAEPAKEDVCASLGDPEAKPEAPDAPRPTAPSTSTTSKDKSVTFSPSSDREAASSEEKKSVRRSKRCHLRWLLSLPASEDDPPSETVSS